MNKQNDPRINAIVLMGVSGCGKTTVGRLLANRLGWDFIESDDYHSNDDVRKMSSGIPLTDKDRWPWLKRLNQVLCEHMQQNQSLVLACSALKNGYRSILADGLSGIVFIYMKGDFTLIHKHMAKRKNHYMKAEMLQSQFDALEEPGDALTVDIAQSPARIVEMILTNIKLE